MKVENLAEWTNVLKYLYHMEKFYLRAHGLGDKPEVIQVGDVNV